MAYVDCIIGEEGVNVCGRCGCAHFIEQGREATLARAVAIIEELGVTAENVQRFEDGERISNMIASRLAGGEEEEIREIADWVTSLHRDLWAERSRTYSRAARQVFDNLPASGPPREVMTTWHQLEQLCKHLVDYAISPSGEVALGEVIRAVNHVHDDNEAYFAELRKRCDMEGL